MQVICRKHGIAYEMVTELEGGTTLYNPCPECRKEEEAGKINKSLMPSDFREMNIEPEYFAASLENFNTPTPELKNAVAKVRKLVSKEIQQLVMVGKNGTGKTHLAVAAVKELRGKIYSMYEISTRIRTTYAPSAKETELQIVDELSRTPLLAIDEIGRTKGSEAEMNWLSYIIDKRHVRGLPLILISNKHPAKDCLNGGCPECLENYIGEDVMSRITEGGVIAYFLGDDYRKKKAGARSAAKEHV